MISGTKPDTYLTERGVVNALATGQPQRARSHGLEHCLTPIELWVIDYPKTAFVLWLLILPIVLFVEQWGIIDGFLRGERSP